MQAQNSSLGEVCASRCFSTDVVEVAPSQSYCQTSRLARFGLDRQAAA